MTITIDIDETEDGNILMRVKCPQRLAEALHAELLLGAIHTAVPGIAEHLGVVQQLEEARKLLATRVEASRLDEVIAQLKEARAKADAVHAQPVAEP